ncbi:MAG: hypothetical protein ACREBM_09145, partial [Sphingomicrobium sp.]
CSLDEGIKSIADVPSRSLLSRLTDHYMQIIANRAPVGFEAEFVNQRSESICYRGILMPFSSDGEAIDFIYGVINWKKEEGNLASSAEPIVALLDAAQADAAPVPPAPGFAEMPVAVEEDGEGFDLPRTEIDANAGLADLLCAARETAELAKAGEGRTRAALYHALSLAYDFALSSRQHPEDFAELLADSGVTAQARAPMTPVVKLVFGIDYDKARLTEFAAALAFADRQSIASGGFEPFIAGQSGGLKALVAAERAARRPEGKGAEDRGEAARARLRVAPPMSLADLGDSGEFALVITRRSADGSYEPVAVVLDEVLAERAIRKAA